MVLLFYTLDFSALHLSNKPDYYNVTDTVIPKQLTALSYPDVTGQRK